MTVKTGAPLSGLRIVELSTFVAAPLGSMTLAQMGADVIRIDPIGGNIDHGRWPLSRHGVSLYWTGLNKAKRSVALALDKPEGRELATALICAPGKDAGVVTTNMPSSGWLRYTALSAQRPDLIMLRLLGNFDGSAALDYTVNCASGFPMATGLGGEPVNHVLPAWDVAAGLYLAAGVLGAERVRGRSGVGQEVTLALSDVMLATVANLGYVADVLVNGVVRPPLGNDLYGAFGRDFATADGRRVMIVAISDRQWREIGEATGLSDRLAMIGPMLELDLSQEGGRFEARHAIAAVLAPWCAARTLEEIKAAFSSTRVLWGPYQDFGQLVREDSRCSTDNPMFAEVDQPGVGQILAPRVPLGFARSETAPPTAAPPLGQDTDAVLAEVLGLSTATIGKLHDRAIVAGPHAR